MMAIVLISLFTFPVEENNKHVNELVMEQMIKTNHCFVHCYLLLSGYTVMRLRLFKIDLPVNSINTNTTNNTNNSKNSNNLFISYNL